MTRKEILAELKRLQPWFHRIDLGDGIFTKTESVMGEPVDHPAEPWRTIKKCLPEDLRGKTVLDVGCNAGFYAIESKRRGATRVFGVDGQRQHVRQAVFVRKVLGMDIEYRRLNVYELNRRTIGTFDITLALGLIYHLKHPILALDNLFEVTNEMLILETAIMPTHRVPPSFTHSFGPVQRTVHSIMYVENPPDAKEQVFNWFLPGLEALVALARNTGFEPVEIVDVKGERAVLICHKRRGPTQETQRRHYVSVFTLEEGLERCHPREDIGFVLRVENTGLASWPAEGDGNSGEGAVQLGAHLLRSDEEELMWDYGRTRLPADLEPGGETRLNIILRAPEEPGDYVIEFDMVAEHVAWFEDFGSGTLRHQLTVDNG